VIVEGAADRRNERTDAEVFVAHVTSKYGGGMSVDFVLQNALYRLSPTWVFGLDEEDFAGSPTRWLPDR
jgi:hypothetical protein